MLESEPEPELRLELGAEGGLPKPEVEMQPSLELQERELRPLQPVSCVHFLSHDQMPTA